MKQTTLILANLRVLWQNNRLFLAAMLLSQCIAVWILLFGIAAILNTLAVEKEIDEMSQYFDVYLANYGESRGEQYDSHHPSFYDNALLLPDMLAACDDILEKADYIDLKTIHIWAKYDIDQPTFGISYHSVGSPLTQSNDPLIQINPGYFPNKKAGDTVFLAGREYIVESVRKDLFLCANIDARFAPEDCICYDVQFGLLSPMTTEEAEDFAKLLRQYFHYYTMYVPETVDPLTAQFNRTTLAMCGIMMVTVILNLCYAQMYVFRQRRRVFAIYRLCGAGRNTVKNICLAETEILAIFCCACAAVLFHFLLERFVTAWYPIADGMYTLQFYLLFGLAYLISFFVMLAVPLEQLVRREVIAVEREGTV